MPSTSDAAMDKTTMATYLPEVWSRTATVTYRSNVVIVPLLDHTWEPEAGVGMGDTIFIPGFSANQRTDVDPRSTFGTAAEPTWKATTEDQTTLNINKMPIDAHAIPVEMSLQTMAGYEAKLIQGIGQAIALYVDYDLASDGAHGFDVFTDIGADNVDITDDVILEGETVLNSSNAPLDGRFFIISPASRASLMQIEVLRNQLYNASVGNLDGSKGAGYLGKIYTLDVYMSNNLKTATSGKYNFIGQRECIAFAAQQEVKVVQELSLKDGIIKHIVGYMVYGRTLVKSSFGRAVLGK